MLWRKLKGKVEKLFLGNAFRADFESTLQVAIDFDMDFDFDS